MIKGGNHWGISSGNVLVWAPILLKYFRHRKYKKDALVFIYTICSVVVVAFKNPIQVFLKERQLWVMLPKVGEKNILNLGLVQRLITCILRYVPEVTRESTFVYGEPWVCNPEREAVPSAQLSDSLYINIESWRVKLHQMIKSLHSLKQTFSWQKCYCMFSLESLTICLG